MVMHEGKLVGIDNHENLLKNAEEEANKTEISDQAKFLADQKVQVLRSIS